MDDKREKIIDRIRKMMALTEDSGAFAGEISAASGKIQELMDKYSITEMELLASQDKDSAPQFEAACSDAVLFTVVAWHWELAHLIARVTHTKTYMKSIYSSDGFVKSTEKKANKTKRPHRANTMVFFGDPSNVAVAGMLYLEWLMKLDNLSEEAAKKYSKVERAKYGFADTKAYRRSWIKGCLDGMRATISEQERSRSEEMTKAIVLVSRALLEAYSIHAAHFSTRRGSSGGRTNSQGFQDGHNVGKGMSLGMPAGKLTASKLLKG